MVCTLAHRAMRQHENRPVLDALHAYLTEQKPLHLPKGPMGQASAYALNQWDALCRFVDDERLPLDNSRSEAALRKAALGRENFLFVGHEAAGENLAGRYALVALPARRAESTPTVPGGRAAARADAPQLAPRRTAAARVEAAARRGLRTDRSCACARPAHRHQPARACRRAWPSSTLKLPQHVVRRTDTSRWIPPRAPASP